MFWEHRNNIWSNNLLTTVATALPNMYSFDQANIFHKGEKNSFQTCDSIFAAWEYLSSVWY